MINKRKLIIAGLVTVLAAVMAISVNSYRSNQQKIVQRQQQILDEGIGLYRQGRYAEALQTLENIEPKDKQDWKVPFFKGASSIRLKDYPAAATYLEQAISLNKTDTQTLYLLGVVYFKLGKLKLAEGYFAATLELDPTHEEARGLMGVMSDLQKRQGQQPDTPPEPVQEEKS